MIVMKISLFDSNDTNYISINSGRWLIKIRSKEGVENDCIRSQDKELRWRWFHTIKVLRLSQRF